LILLNTLTAYTATRGRYVQYTCIQWRTQ